MAGIDDEADGRAAERALGTEPPGPETAEERDAREAWERLLAPLALLAPEVAPPASAFERALARIDADEASARELASFEQATARAEAERLELRRALRRAERRASRWRGLAVGVPVALAAGVALAVIAPQVAPDLFPRPAPVEVAETPQPSGRYVALVTPGGGGPALIVEIELGAGVATVRPVGVEPPEGRALELWRIAPGAAPVSAGLIDPDRATPATLEAEPGDVLAVSSEPPGGSPTGAPTGEVLFTGPVIAVE